MHVPPFRHGLGSHGAEKFKRKNGNLSKRKSEREKKPKWVKALTSISFHEEVTDEGGNRWDWRERLFW